MRLAALVVLPVPPLFEMTEKIFIFEASNVGHQRLKGHVCTAQSLVLRGFQRSSSPIVLALIEGAVMYLGVSSLLFLTNLLSQPVEGW